MTKLIAAAAAVTAAATATAAAVEAGLIRALHPTFVSVYITHKLIVYIYIHTYAYLKYLTQRI